MDIICLSIKLTKYEGESAIKLFRGKKEYVLRNCQKMMKETISKLCDNNNQQEGTHRV